MSWHYLPELVGACLGDSSPASAASAPWKRSRTAEKSSCGASGTACYPCSLSGTISSPSAENPGVGSWMSSLLASRASPSARPVSDEVPPTSATSGQTPCAAFARFDPATSSWRTYPDLFPVAISARSSETWPQAGMTQRGVAFRLSRSELLTSAKGGGAWLPTPTVGHGKQAGGNVKKWNGANSLHEMARTSLWPSPTVNDSKGKGYTYDQGDKTRPRLALTGMARLWPTPNVPNGGRKPKGGMSPTGMTPDGKKRQVGLENAVRMWPTPRSTDGEHGGRVTPRKARNGGNLIEAVSKAEWPTPSARDWKSGKASEATMEKNARPLSEMVGGSLNPVWVEWLQGVPLGWTDLRPLEICKFRSWLRAHGGE